MLRLFSPQNLSAAQRYYVYIWFLQISHFPPLSLWTYNIARYCFAFFTLLAFRNLMLLHSYSTLCHQLGRKCTAKCESMARIQANILLPWFCKYIVDIVVRVSCIQILPPYTNLYQIRFCMTNEDEHACEQIKERAHTHNLHRLWAKTVRR